jgi:hypothetical protein
VDPPASAIIGGGNAHPMTACLAQAVVVFIDRSIKKDTA